MLQNLQAALESTGLPFAHFAWSKASAEYMTDHGVWAEDNDNTLMADNRHGEGITQGSIDYYTRSDNGEAKAIIEAALNAFDIAYGLNSIIYEEDTGFIHYEWIFEAV